MKIGLSSYSLHRAIASNEMTVLDAIQWIADHGGQHMEVVPIGFDLTGNPELIDAIRHKASDAGIELSNYAIGADFLKAGDGAFEQEIERVKRQVDIADSLGLKLMRHDVAWSSDNSIKHFNESLERMASACMQIADYASKYGITTSVENHGYFVQASDRVQALIHAVNRPNFKTTMDVGNFMCADESSVSAVKKNIAFASMVHIKDFYLRPSDQNPGEGYFKTAGGDYLRGAIIGQGDINMREVLRIIKQSGYDGYLSVEFEGMEDCLLGSKISMDNLQRLWSEV
ncbi:sugar phosphate isomerase/epimerase [Paenibacillus rhizovicinus]|uniref:Sugar phosphate isomerase/epimerase n=1 Tax=Paenibacillus rhizovicinus TaxID=2704463 RepID=A0A6C0NTM6_9BACL|nr:sugar phosphate isomerase/epimerase family protein [Paenibacillus rhizovicinus]QHW29517.1 sugar phosphate isomerase/epimerase [Paenibacillus rhizovicinus]